jgi:hypothetical protein
MKTVRIIVDENGSVRLDFDGYIGKQCDADAAKIIEELKRLGVIADTKRIDYKPTYTSVKKHVSVRA